MDWAKLNREYFQAVRRHRSRNLVPPGNPETPLRDRVTGRPSPPSMAFDARLPRSLLPDLTEAQLLSHRGVELDVDDEEIERRQLRKIVRSGPPVLTVAEQKAALQARLNERVRQMYEGKSAPPQNDRDTIRKIISTTPGSTWEMANEAIRQLPQARRRKR